MRTLPIQKAYLLPTAPVEQKWLIEGLWSFEAVGIIGGEPKCGKSILALSIAIAVASARPCLGRFTVNHPGRVLLFAGEDALHIVRARLMAIARSSQIELSALDIFVITRPSLRLDIEAEYELLKATVEKLSPRLLILDPFVRLHRIDENQASEVAPLLSQLRSIQRAYHCSVILVHHARKDAGNVRAGQALRGSSEFHAWGDSNLYLQRKRDETLLLTVEHRAEKSLPQLPLMLASNELGPFHQILDAAPAVPDVGTVSPEKKIREFLASSQIPLPFREIRAATKLRSQVTSDTLRHLTQEGAVEHSTRGYSLNK